MDTPAPPDPMATAQAQQQMNTETAKTQAGLNNVNQVTPDGSLTYTQSTWPDGTPRYTATTSLNPVNQSIYDTNKVTSQNIANIGSAQSARIGDLLNTPFSVNQAISDKIDALGRQRLDPQFAQSEEALRTQLANSGIKAGSAAFDAEMRDFSQGKNDAYNSLYLNGNQQALTQSLAERNQPINEITALMSGSQVSMPQFQNTPQTQVGGVNYTGLVSDNYKAQTAANAAQMGGLFGAGGQVAGAAVKYLPMMMA